MWQSIIDGTMESLDDFGTSIKNGWAQIQNERARQPEVKKAQEPIKAPRPDGSTKVFQPTVQPPFVFDRNTMLIGGALLLGAIMMLRS
ncbi:hypothetical protein [Pseudoalteromonas sp. Of7M-16]|uniref:hypothetical protein n=1 Tax=Pseudoalteromonas sp. Of7M-16 TaxID=2917756 RepID=UPI001EF54B8F|nr:hypothetical protein [Pseudoalteromonas sp. Of7M-16]MCG7546960.1 hypothetical protein [Pseudoalteromonas sp. Of7M-16]